MQGGAQKGKVSDRSKKVGIKYDLRRTSKEENGKSDNGENLDSSCSDVPAEESANTLNIESISKSENSVKSSIVIVSQTEKLSADENGKKLDMI